MTTDLDTRLNRAAGALRHSVAEMPIGEPRRPGRSPVALGLGVLMVAGVLAATVAVRSGGGSVDLDVEPAALVQPLIADPLPDGLEVGWVGEQTAQAAAGAEAGVESDGDTTAGVGGATTAGPVDLYTYIYGEVGSDNPFATSDMVVNVWDSSTLGLGVDSYGEADIAAAAGTAVTVRGHGGMIGAVDDVATVRWFEGQDLEVVLASRRLSSDQLLAIAEALAIEGTAVALAAVPTGIPGSLDEVAALGGAAVAGARSTVASWVGYTGVGGGLGQVVDITTLAGGPDELMALVWELGSTEQVLVRGQQAWFATGAALTGVAGTVGADQAVELVWQEATGVLVHVTALGLSQGDVLGLVDGLHASTADEWAMVTELATTARAAAASAAETATDAAGDVAGGAEVSEQAGVDPGGLVEEATGTVTDVVTDIQATLHDDLGTDAVVGTVGSLLDGVGAGVEDLTGSAETDAGSGGGGLLDP